MKKEYFILIIILAAAVTFVLIILPSATRENTESPDDTPLVENPELPS